MSRPESAATLPWKQRAEGGWQVLITAYIWMLLRLGRGFGRVILLFVCAYFLLVRGFERRASKAYLRRVLPHHPRLRDVARHFWTFSQCAVDRVFLLGSRRPPLTVEVEGLTVLDEALQQGRGAILLGAHYGSFEACRLISLRQQEVPIRVVMDLARSARINSVMQRLNPQFARQVIDVGGGGDRAILAIKDALDAGGAVGMLADRAQGRERKVGVDFLGGRVELPQSPYLIAAVTGAPVLLIHGTFEGGRHYRVCFERFADRIQLPRGERQAAMQRWAQSYADHLGRRVVENPWNWFNFYDFWSEM